MRKLRNLILLASFFLIGSQEISFQPKKGDLPVIDIFVFDRTGKIYSRFNHKGQSGMEYTWIGSAGVILDEKNLTVLSQKKMEV